MTTAEAAKTLTNDEQLVQMLCMYKKRPNWDETQEFMLEDDLSGKVAEHCDQLFGSEPQNTGRNTVSN